MKRIYIALSTALTCIGAIAADVAVTPGSLSDALVQISPATSATLNLSGHVDARDLSLMRNLPADVMVINLADVKIDAWKTDSGKLFDRTYIEANVIPSYCFFNTHYSEVILPQSVTLIETGAFAGSDITSISIPEGVTEIGEYAFYGCASLKQVSLPSTLRKIGKGAFGGCANLPAIDMTDTQIAEIPEGCFAGCSSLKVATVAGTTRSIDKEAFRGTSVYMLDLSDVTTLKPYALSGMTALKELRLNPSASVGVGVLMDDSNLMQISGAPEDVPALFAANCSNLNTSLHTQEATSIGAYAFANSTTSTLVLSGNLTKIEDGAFYAMPNLNYITADALKGNIPEVSEHSFDGISRPDISLYVDDDHYQEWTQHPEWNQFNVISATVTSVDTISSQTDIHVSADADWLSIQAPENVTQVDIYSADGRLLLHNPGGKTSLNISLKDIPDNIIIVAVATDNVSRSVKLMK